MKGFRIFSKAIAWFILVGWVFLVFIAILGGLSQSCKTEYTPEILLYIFGVLFVFLIAAHAFWCLLVLSGDQKDIKKVDEPEILETPYPLRIALAAILFAAMIQLTFLTPFVESNCPVSIFNTLGFYLFKALELSLPFWLLVDLLRKFIIWVTH